MTTIWFTVSVYSLKQIELMKLVSFFLCLIVSIRFERNFCDKTTNFKRYLHKAANFQITL